jgi:hypothetical protein
MRGGIGWQITKLFNDSGIFTPGVSRHSGKEAARELGCASKADIARATTLYSYGTAEEYKSIWHDIAEFAREALGVKDVEKINEDVVREYLLARIEGGVALATYNKEASACTKLETALNMYAAKKETENVYNFRGVQKEVGAIARKSLEKTEGSRSYDDPRALVSVLEGKESSIVARLQLEGGARVSEGLILKECQLLQGNTIHLNNTKGGLPRDISVASETYRELRDYVQRYGEFRHVYSTYYNDLKSAARVCGQKWQGTHGLRWNYAQESFAKKQQDGMSYHESMQAVSRELGHHRLDITEHYLR